ncbi:MAG TPA: hypothetical protein DET40_05005 [Lentisphaeria bacterium]|nr:MAG: hypothetical protein A2X45_13580 [Lentisphaerae bacterium GWF2_50_93]HCE42885.1 hypothetical protein [Lentisphaeria bacterium]
MGKDAYEVRNIKTFMGNEGHGFNAALYRDGMKVADVHDMADGGCYSYYFKEEAERKIFFEYARKNSATDEIEPWDSYVAGMVDAYLLDRKLRRLCRKEVLFRLQGDKEGLFHTLSRQYSQETAAELRRKYGASLVEIVNERYIGKEAGNA